MADTVDQLALGLGLAAALVPIVVVLVVWLYVRIRFVRNATQSQRFIDAGEDLDLFALRAMATQPMRALARVSDDPAGAWRRQDRDVIRQPRPARAARPGPAPAARHVTSAARRPGLVRVRVGCA